MTEPCAGRLDYIGMRALCADPATGYLSSTAKHAVPVITGPLIGYIQVVGIIVAYIQLYFGTARRGIVVVVSLLFQLFTLPLFSVFPFCL